MSKDDVKMPCRSSKYDKVDYCAPRNLLNEFYFKRSSLCTENMHGSDILVTSDRDCGWYDSDTNTLIETKDPISFKFKNRHHKPDEPKKIYIWKRKHKTRANKKRKQRKSRKHSRKRK